MPSLTVISQLETITSIVQDTLKDQLIALYLHGSAVQGGLKHYSDIDLLAVIQHPLTTQHKHALIAQLLNNSGHYPSDKLNRRPIELMLFTQAELAHLHYPACCEFIYGEWLRNDYRKGTIYQAEQDPEYTLVLAQAAQHAELLAGQPKHSILPCIKPQAIRQAIQDCLPNLLASLAGDQRNVLLTLARMWRTLAEGDFLSKDQAALWAAKQSPYSVAELLNYAAQAYLSGHDQWHDKQAKLRETVSYLTQKINTLLAA